MTEKEKKEPKTIEECLAMGIHWEDCVKLIDAETLQVVKACPNPMKQKLKEQAFSGKGLSVVEEK